MGGSLSHAADAMRRIQRRMSRQAEERRQWRKARRRSGLPVEDEWGEPDEVDFPCALLCSECGYYLDPLVNVHPEQCPSCRGEAWVDLSLDTTVDSLREAEHRSMKRSRPRVRVMSIMLTITLLVTIGVVLVTNLSIGWVFVYLPVVPVAGFLTEPKIRELIQRVDRSLGIEPKPARWSLPTWSDGETNPVANFVLPVDADVIEAPFSGRKVCGYLAVVEIDLPGSTLSGQRVVVESRNVALDLKGRRIERDKAVVDGNLEQVAGADALDNPDSDPRAHRLRRFLRERGIRSFEGDFTFFEVVIEPRSLVTLMESRDITKLVAK